MFISNVYVCICFLLDVYVHLFVIGYMYVCILDVYIVKFNYYILVYIYLCLFKCVIVMNARVYFCVLVLKTCMYEHVCLNYKCMYPYIDVCTFLTNVFIVYMVVLYVSMYVCVEENTSHSHCEY